MGECSMAARRVARHLQHMHLNGLGLAEVVTLSGWADFWRAHAVELEVRHALRNGARRFVVDLTAATAVDSAMLRSLILAQKEVRGLAGQVVFACGEAPMRLFHVTGLDGLMHVVGSREEALALVGR